MQDSERMRSASTVSGPNFKSSTSSIRRRKSSISEPHLRTHVGELPGNDLLLDPLIMGQAVHVGNHPESPIDNVRRVLGGRENEPSDPMLTEMMKLIDKGNPQKAHWEQTTRWIKYEQIVEGDGTRFSKPHITLLNVQGLLQLRNCLKKGVVMLDVEANGFTEIAESIVNAWKGRHRFGKTRQTKLLELLKAPKYHLGGSPGVNVYGDGDYRATIAENDSTKANDRKLSSKDVEEKNEDEEESDDDDEDIKADEEPSTEDNGRRFGHVAKIVRSNKRLLAKLHDALSACIMIGQTSVVDRPMSALVRLKYAQNLHPDLPDVPVPCKFIFVTLTPRENFPGECESIGRTMGAMFADEIWRKVAMVAYEPHSLVDAIEEFFSQIVVIPPGKCNTNTRWEPREEQVKRNLTVLYSPVHHFDDEVFTCSDEELNVDKDETEKGSETGGGGHEQAIVRTGRLFGGLVEDIKRKAPVFGSDFADFFTGRLSQSLASTLFIFFANITSIITFGAVMERALHHQMAAIEAILCGGISGVIFALFSGQPLNILSATGPTLVFEKILFDFCVGNGWEFLPFRAWVGVWICVYLLILVATDTSALVGLITRFTEEAFATLISVVFIVQAFQKLLQISHDAPLFPDPREVIHSPCFCHVNRTHPLTNMTYLVKLKDKTAEDCEGLGGQAIGLQCHFKPDVYMLSVLLTFGTFTLAYLLSRFRKSAFFASGLRNAISDFGVLLSIIVMTCFSHFIGLDVPVLHMPESFRPSLHRSWLVDPSVIPWQVVLIAALPAAFYTILIVMDQQITAVIINRKDNKLKKGGGYHLDLLIIALLVFICSFLGLPFFVAATVLSVMHIDSLRVYSESSAPGEVPQFLGVNEQRMTAIVAHVLIGLSVFLTPVIKLVPLPVLIGIFLYMGVVSLFGQQFVQRITLLFTTDKHQPDYIWLRLVRMKRVHLFTFVQMAAMAGLFAVKYAKGISMMFPLMLVFMVLIRMFFLSKMFTKQELLALDDAVPSFKDIMQPKNAKKKANLRFHLDSLSVLDELDELKKEEQIA